MVSKCNFHCRKLAYHKFVKTTPKPRATKKRSGELGPPLLVPVDVGDADAEVAVAETIVDEDDIVYVLC